MPEKIEKICTFSTRVLSWADKKGRYGLPWHPKSGEKFNAYKIWISEVMLQQTQLKTVISYYKNFINIYPTVQSLAESKIEDILFHWSGLGYYRRAINLHEGAKKLYKNKKIIYPKQL